jgi:hypothetical protein
VYSSYSQQISCCSLYVLYIFFNSRTSLNKNFKIFVFVLLSNPPPKTCACIFIQTFSYIALYSADFSTPPPPTSHQLFLVYTLGQITEICDSNSNWQTFDCLKTITPQVTGFVSVQYVAQLVTLIFSLKFCSWLRTPLGTRT